MLAAVEQHGWNEEREMFQENHAPHLKGYMLNKIPQQQNH